MNQKDVGQHALLIWDDSELPSESVAKDRTVIFWSRNLSKGFDGAVSIPERIEVQANILRNRYLSWIYKMGEFMIQGSSIAEHMLLSSGFSAWWMSLLVEKCNFSKSTQITDAIKLMAFVDWMEGRDVKQLILLSRNADLAKCLENLCSRRAIRFEHRYVESKCARLLNFSKNLYLKTPHFFRALVWLAFYLRSRWALRGAGVLQWQQSQGALSFISYMFNLAPKATSQGIFESSYWGHLPEVALSKGVKTNWLHIYIGDSLIPTAKKAAELINIFNQESKGVQCHVALDSFLSANIIIKVLLDWFHLLCKDMRLQMKNSMPRLGELDLWSLFENDWKSSFRGVAGISNILSFHLFHAAFTGISKRKLGFYLLENQGWELGMLHAWKSNKHECIVGYAHATVRYWDLRYFFDSDNHYLAKNNSLPIPDKVAVNGLAAKTLYIEADYPEDQLIEVEALRYLYLNQFSHNKINTSENEISHTISSQDNRKLRLLVLCDYVESQTHLMMGFLSEIANQLPADISIIIKPHPGLQFGPNEYSSLTYTVVNNPLSELLPNADVVYTSDITSAAVDAYCAGIPVISTLDHRSLNLSPLRGRNGVTFVANPIELLGALNLIFNFPKQQFKNESIFHLDESLPRWSEIVTTFNKELVDVMDSGIRWFQPDELDSISSSA